MVKRKRCPSVRFCTGTTLPVELNSDTVKYVALGAGLPRVLHKVAFERVQRLARIVNIYTMMFATYWFSDELDAT